MIARFHAAYTSEDHSAVNHDNLTINHSGLEGVTADQHHAKSHNHSTADGSGAGPLLLDDGSTSAPAFSFDAKPGLGWFTRTDGSGDTLSAAYNSSNMLVEFGLAGMTIPGFLGFSSSTNPSQVSSNNADARLYREASYTIGQRHGLSPQTFRVYNTWTDASNYERVALTWSGNQAFLTQQSAGTGAPRTLSIGTSGASELRFYVAGVDRWEVGTSYIKPQADNAYDIGASFSSRIRDLFIGGRVLSGSAPALSGALAVGNAAVIVAARNAANTADITVLGTNASNQILLGGTNSGDVFLAPGSTNVLQASTTTLTVLDAKNFAFSTTTGTKFGTAVTQKMGWWNATPVAQVTGWSVTNGTTNKTLDVTGSTTAQLYQVVGTIIDTLKSYGIFGA